MRGPNREVSGAVGLPEEVEVTVEVPRGSRIKRGPEGAIEFVSPIACPFNYGSVHAVRAPDGDPLDALVLGPRLAIGHTGRWRVLGVVDFVDAGIEDTKLVCGDGWTTADRASVLAFFGRYARIKRLANRLRGRRGATTFRGLRDH